MKSLTIEKLLLQNIAAIGENIIIRRFVRWELGEESSTMIAFWANRQVGPFVDQRLNPGGEIGSDGCAVRRFKKWMEI